MSLLIMLSAPAKIGRMLIPPLLFTWSLFLYVVLAVEEVKFAAILAFF
jgi:hypothetical protein